MACPAMDGGAPFLGSVLGYLDCQAQGIGEGGYQALSGTGSTGSALLTAVLVLFVALFGFRMLFGQVPQVRDGVLAVAKIGVVLALATSWPAYRTLVYDVALKGPADLGAAIGQQAGLPGAGGGLAAWLQSADDAFLLLAALGTEPTQPQASNQTQAQGLGNTQSPTGTQTTDALGNPRPRPNPAFDALMLGWARILFLVGTVASLAVVRLTAGLLLALGPVFAVFLLFDGTRGLFEGWVRGLGAAALGALGVAVVLGVELAFLDPWLLELVAERQQDLAISGVPVELFAFAAVFALALAGVLAGVARVALGFRLPAALSNWSLTQSSRVSSAAETGVTQRTLQAASAPLAEHDRARAVADAVAATQRREAAAAAGGAATAALLQRSTPAGRPASGDAALSPALPIGQNGVRRTRNRISAGATRRDRIR